MHHEDEVFASSMGPLQEGPCAPLSAKKSNVFTLRHLTKMAILQLSFYVLYNSIALFLKKERESIWSSHLSIVRHPFNFFLLSFFLYFLSNYTALLSQLYPLLVISLTPAYQASENHVLGFFFFS